jgi:hypothetical protein
VFLEMQDYMQVTEQTCVGLESQCIHKKITSVYRHQANPSDTAKDTKQITRGLMRAYAILCTTNHSLVCIHVSPRLPLSSIIIAHKRGQSQARTGSSISMCDDGGARPRETTHTRLLELVRPSSDRPGI